MVRARSILLAVGAAICVSASASQQPASDDGLSAEDREMCAQIKCQRDLRVALKDKDGKPYDRTFAAFPAIVDRGTITIVAGQQLYIEADIAGDRLVNLVAVDQMRQPSKTVTARFSQAKDGMMLLELRNPFDRPLKFNIGMMPLDKEELYKTSSCPVMAGKMLFESWPYPIFQLVLANPRLLVADASQECVK
jgi:hypothetical protein